MELDIEPMGQDGTIRIRPIGHVRSTVTEERTGGFEAAESTIDLRPEFAEFLQGIEGYSHIVVVYWLSGQRTALSRTQPQSHPEAPYVGMFACR